MTVVIAVLASVLGIAALAVLVGKLLARSHRKGTRPTDMERGDHW